MSDIIAALLTADEPSVRYRVLVNVVGESPDSPQARRLQTEIASSERVRTLLSEQDSDGRIPRHPYAKWRGAHWVLADLANLDYPSGDESLIPLKEQVYGAWLSPTHTAEFVCETRADVYRKRQYGVPIMDGRPRRCGSQEGNALYSTLALGIADDRADQLAANLVRWQWDDGGWNCDKNPTASISSFIETLLPMRGLALHARLTGNTQSRAAVKRAAEVFLTRHLYKRRRTGELIREEFIKLHYPAYWHYDVLFGLKVMAEAGFLHDERCRDALNLLESKRLPDGGFPAEGKHYRSSDTSASGVSLVDWGGTSRRTMNPFVTADALSVLKAAGRLPERT